MNQAIDRGGVTGLRLYWAAMKKGIRKSGRGTEFSAQSSPAFSIFPATYWWC